MDLELSGRVALVTGSYRGTGRGIAARLAAEGATLLLHGFNAEVAGREAARLRETGGDVRAVAGDVCSDDGAAAMVDAALAVAGQVDVLVNNYGVAAGPGWWDGTDDDWLDSYQRNVRSGVRLVRALVPGTELDNATWCRTSARELAVVAAGGAP